MDWPSIRVRRRAGPFSRGFLLVFDISPLAARHGPWSISKAGTASTCPAQFKHKYITKTEGGITSSGNKVGLAAHTVLEHRVDGVSAVVAQTIALAKTPLTGQECDDLRTLNDAIEAFLQRFEVFCKREHITEILREVAWGITAKGEPTGFFADDVYFRGKLDLCALTPNKDLFVLDHKSGVAREISRDLSKKHQLYSYAVLAAHNLDVQGVRCGINFLQGKEDLRLQWLDYIPLVSISAIYTPWLFGHLNDVAENLVEPFSAKPRASWPCKWCDFRQVCKPYQELTGGA